MFDTAVDQDYFSLTETQQEVLQSFSSLIEAQTIIEQALLYASGAVRIPFLDKASAIAISDRDAPDLPVIHVSHGFEVLTGYGASDILGQNCRLLQLPNNLTPGRSVGPLPAYNGYDQVRVLLRQKIQDGEAASLFIINYHKSGHAFLNGLTVIPVSYEQSRYYVGFLSDASLPYLGATIGDFFDRETVTYRSNEILSQVPNGSFMCNSPKLVEDNTSLPDQSSPHTSNVPPVRHEIQTLSTFNNESIDSDAMLSNLLDSCDQILCIVSFSLQIHLASKGMSLLLGVPSEDLCGLSLLEIVHKQDVATVQRQFRKLSSGSSCEVICRVANKHEDVAYIEFCVSKIPSAKHTPSYLVLCGRKVPALVIPERLLTEEKQSMYPPLWAKISRTGIILFGTSGLKSLFHGQISSEEPVEDTEVIGLTFQSRMCQHSRTKFEHALASISKREKDLVTVCHCFDYSQGGKLVMISDLMLPESRQETKSDNLPAFILIRMQHTASGGTQLSFSNQHSSKQLARKSSRLDCDRTCQASSLSSPTLNSRKSKSKSTPQSEVLRTTTQTMEPRLVMGTTTVTMQEAVTATATAMTTTTITAIPVTTSNTLQADESIQGQAMVDIFAVGMTSSQHLSSTSDATPLGQDDVDACWQYKIQSLSLANTLLRKELAIVLAHNNMKRRRRAKVNRKGLSCANCHTIDTPEWRRGPSGERDLCNRCGLKYTKDRKKGQQENRIATSIAEQGGINEQVQT